MKRYLVFTFAGYYPYGGWHDFKGDYSNLNEARLASLHFMEEHSDPYFQIVDSKTKQIIEGSKEV